MNKIITESGKTLNLKSLYPAMVMDENGDERTCRTIYEDQYGGRWCFWYGRYVGVKKIDGSKLERGRRVKKAYVVSV